MYDMPNPLDIVGTGNDVSTEGRIGNDVGGLIVGRAVLCELIDVGFSEPRFKPAALGTAVPPKEADGAGAFVDTLPEEGSMNLLGSFESVGLVELVGTALNTGSGVNLPVGTVSVGFSDTLGR